MCAEYTGEQCAEENAIALAQAKDEQEKRIQAERELTEVKAKLSKEVGHGRDIVSIHIAHVDPGTQALLHSSVAETWPDVAAGLPKLEELFAPFTGAVRETPGLPSNRQTPLSSVSPDAFSTGLATPQSQVGTVDAEPTPSERAISEAVDLSRSATGSESPAAGSLKRPASPSSLDNEQSALKRRRMQEIIDGTPGPSQERPGTPKHQSLPPPSRSPPPSPVHEFGAAPLLMGSLTAEPGEITSPSDDPDQTLVDAPVAPDVPMDDTKSEEGELTPVEAKPQTRSLASVVGLRRTQPTPPAEEEEDGEIKQEVLASPKLAPALSPALPVRPLPQPDTRTLPGLPPSFPRRPSAGASFTRPAPTPVVAYTLPLKPVAPTPSPTRPPVRRTLTISHINLAYDQVGRRYTCVMCKYVL